MENIRDYEKIYHRIKVIIIGEGTEELYNKLKSCYELESVKEIVPDINIWENVDVGIIVAYAIDKSSACDLVSKKFDYLVKCAKENAKFTLPILVSENYIKDNVLLIKPSEFQNEVIDYYVYNTVMSIVDILSSYVVRFDIADLINFLIVNNKTKFTYGDSKADCAITDATNIAINRVKADIHNIRVILFNIIGSEKKLNMDEIIMANDIINGYCKNATIIWGVGVDNDLGETVKVSLWLGIDS